MSKQIHGENCRKKQVKFRASSELVAEFDQYLSESEQYDSRADALRACMRATLSGEDTDAPLQPPADEQLRRGYLVLVRIASKDGIIPHEIAKAELSTDAGKSQSVVNRQIIKTLHDRNYLRKLATEQGRGRAWELVGWSE